MALSLFFSQARSFVNIRKLHFNIVFQVLRGCFRIFRGCSGNLFRVLWGVPRCSGYVACFTDTRRTFHSNSGVIIHVMSSPKNFFLYIILPSVLGKTAVTLRGEAVLMEMACTGWIRMEEAIQMHSWPTAI